MKTSHVIADMYDMGRKFNLYYLSKLDPALLHHRPVIDGREGNSAYWIACHLLWAEVEGVLRATGYEVPESLNWVKEFGIGQNPYSGHTAPDFAGVMEIMAGVHQVALEHIRSHSDEDLQIPAYVAASNWNTVRQKAFYHFIRHESFHTGQISIIGKAAGVVLP